MTPLAVHEASVSYHDGTPAELRHPVFAFLRWQNLRRDNLQIKTDDTVHGGELCAEGDALLFHPRRTFLVPLQKSDPRTDSSTLGVASPYVRGSCRPLPPSSSTPGIELKSIFHHTQAVICKDVIVQCIYYTVYTIYMMSQTFIP